MSKSIRKSDVIAFRILVKFHKPISKFTGKFHSMMEFFNCKVTASNFNEREPHHKCFPINFAKFFRTASLKIISKRLLLNE